MKFPLLIFITLTFLQSKKQSEQKEQQSSNSLESTPEKPDFTNKREFRDLLKPRKLVATRKNEIYFRNSISRGKKRLVNGNYAKDIDTGLTPIEMQRKKSEFLERRFQHNPLIRDYRDVIRTKKEPFYFVSDEQGRQFPLMEKTEYTQMLRRNQHMNYTRANIKPIYGNPETPSSVWNIHTNSFPDDYSYSQSDFDLKLRGI